MKKILFFVFVLFLVALMAGCTRSMSEAPAPAIVQATPTRIPTRVATLVPPVQSTAVPVAMVSVEKSDSFAGLDKCPYVGTGSPQPEKVNVSTFKIPDGRTVYALDLSKLPGCAIVFEGRFPWQTAFPGLVTLLSQSGITPWDPWDVHFIVDIRSELGNFDPVSYNKLVGVPQQYENWLVYSEGSIWFYDPTWNISNLKTVKPSISQELEVKKFRDAMTPGEYNWPRVIMQPSGQIFAFWQHDSGEAAYTNGTAAGCTISDRPELIPVYGLWNGESFSAAIGAGNCKMVYWADGSETPVIWYGYQKDGKTIVSYQTSVIAYMFPTKWSDDQVNSWTDDHPGGK